jgi:hypothetical protein
MGLGASWISLSVSCNGQHVSERAQQQEEQRHHHHIYKQTFPPGDALLHNTNVPQAVLLLPGQPLAAQPLFWKHAGHVASSVS